LLENGAETELSMREVKATPLNFAANKGYVSVVELLLSHGANVDNKKNDGKTVSNFYLQA
jgi:hypothetical protein